MNFWNLLLTILSPFIFVIIGIILSFIVQFIYLGTKGNKIQGKIPQAKKIGFFKRLLILFPNRLAKDIYNRNPLDFKEHGLHLFCGEQGSGKTTALVEMLLRWKQRYPAMKIYSNMAYKHEDGKLNHWKDILDLNNDTYGATIVIDEIQTWFSSNESKDFPPEMLTEISQQRKQRKAIIGTAQVFSRIAKPIREQATYIYLPMTFLGCLTIVRKTKSEWWDNEKQKFKRYLGMYFFVHTEEIRNSFDTYKKIEKYKIVGFKRPNWIDSQKVEG